MDGNTGYTYFQAGSKKLATKSFTILICVSKHRNASGNFLIWRQVNTYAERQGKMRKWKQTARFDFKYSPSKKEAFEIARKWSARLLSEV